MVPTVFKAFGVLYFVMQNTVLNLNFSNIQIKDIYKAEFIKSSYTINAHREFSDEKVEPLRKSEVMVRYKPERVPTPLSTPQAEKHNERRITPSEVQLPVSLAPTEPLIPTTSIFPTNSPIQTPIPTQFTPEPTIILIPSIPSQCGCEYTNYKNTDIVCPVYVKEMPCIDTF